MFAWFIKDTRYCTQVTETFSIVDAWKHISTGTHQFTSNALTHYPMFTIPSDNANYVFEGTLNSPQGYFGYGIKQYDNNDNTYYIRTLVNNNPPNKQTGIVNSTESNQNGSAYTANTDVKCKMEFNNGTVKLYIDDVLLQTGQVSYYPKYLTLINWNSAKTLTFKDIVIKPL